MRTLIAGFGNVLLGDDGFGVEVIRTIEAMKLHDPKVQTIDVGIGGLPFVLALLDRFDRTIIVDTVRAGSAAGTLHQFTGDAGEHTVFDPHLLEPSRALALARALGAQPNEVVIIGCEPYSCEPRVGLSRVVTASVPKAVSLVMRLIEEQR